MTTATRLAIVAGVVLMLGAVAATFLPTSPEGRTCGTWVSPEWTDEGVADLSEGVSDLTTDDLTNDVTGELNQQLAVIAMAAAENKQICDDALGTRRTASLVLLGLAILVPAAVVFVTRGRSGS